LLVDESVGLSVTAAPIFGGTTTITVTSTAALAGEYTFTVGYGPTGPQTVDFIVAADD